MLSGYRGNSAAPTGASSGKAVLAALTGAMTLTSLTVNGLVDLSNAAAGQIKFPATQNASADANTLDDYEEGTFTPGFDFDTTGDLSVTYNQRYGVYTKIGNCVQGEIYLQSTAFTHSTAAGNFRITGLPVTADYASSVIDIPSVANLQGVIDAAHSQWMPAPVDGTTYFNVHGSGSGASINTLTTTEVPTVGGGPKPIYYIQFTYLVA